MEHAMDYHETSKVTGLNERTLRNYVSQKKIPYYKLGASVRFSPSKIQGWLDERAIEPLAMTLNGRAGK